ncbi:MAG: hypothetical protein ACK4QL_10110 [Pseudanabaenaceae cyanobacterium]
MNDPQILRQAIVNELEQIAPQDLPALYQMVRKFATARARRRRPCHSSL